MRFAISDYQIKRSEFRMIHGHKKAKKEKSEQQAREEDQLSQKINNKLAEFFALSRKDVSVNQIPKYLEFIALLMQLCTDIPTIFNFRRELVIRAMQNRSAEESGQLLAGEIKLTTKLIQSDPKSYTIWSYRQWLVKSLFSINSKVIKTQKQLIKMLLMKDQKNFHVWNYRNWLNSIQSNIDEDLHFTQQKIKSNPFNFSPYHFRTKFLHEKYQKVLATEISQDEHRQIITYGMPKALLDEEFQGIKTAIFLNPNEEAPWLYYNWLLGQLIPTFIAFQQIKEDRIVLHFNMKLNDFSKFIEGDYQSVIGKDGKEYTDTWEVLTSHPATVLKIRSNLQEYSAIGLESTSKLFLGNFVESKWLEEHIKSILKRQIQFIDEVIQSQQKVCRFAFLQKASIYKLILQLGTTTAEYDETIESGLNSLLSIEKEPKAQKYTLKQLQYWQRLKKGKLTTIEQALRSKFD